MNQLELFLNNIETKDNKPEIQNPDGFYKVTVAAIDENDADVEVFVGTIDDPFIFGIEPGTMVIKFTKAQVSSGDSASPQAGIEVPGTPRIMVR